MNSAACVAKVGSVPTPSSMLHVHIIRVQVLSATIYGATGVILRFLRMHAALAFHVNQILDKVLKT